MKKKSFNSVISTNRRASYDYFLSDFLEVGIVLKGTEIKAIRQHKVSLKDTFIYFKDGEAFIAGLHIPQYDKGNLFNHEPERTRILLMHKREIRKYAAKVQAEGFTCIPTKMYYVRGRVKVEIALAKGKKTYDKREAIKTKDIEREIRSNLKRSSDNDN